MLTQVDCTKSCSSHLELKSNTINTKQNCFSRLDSCCIYTQAVCTFNVGLSAANKHKKKKNGNNAVDVFHEVELLHRQCSSHRWCGRCCCWSSEKDNTNVTCSTCSTSVWGGKKSNTINLIGAMNNKSPIISTSEPFYPQVCLNYRIWTYF